MIKAAAIDFRGRVWVGKNHADCIRAFHLETGRTAVRTEVRQGFITDEGRFVTRGYAGMIARKCGQTTAKPTVFTAEHITCRNLGGRCRWDGEAYRVEDTDEK